MIKTVGWYDINSLIIFIFRYIYKRNIRNRLVCLSSKVAKKALP